MTRALTSRSTISGFVERTLINLQFVTYTLYKNQVHSVMQIILSMLGILVFLHEHLNRNFPLHTKFYNSLAEAKDWPDWNKWEFDPQMKKALDTRDNLPGLLKHLRNSVSHYRINFSSSVDSRDPAEVTIEFCDCASPNAPTDWHASINGPDLQSFIINLAKHANSALLSL